jgi:hypothetical protein
VFKKLVNQCAGFIASPRIMAFGEKAYLVNTDNDITLIDATGDGQS